MITTTISEAKARLSALIDAAERGEDVLIMRGAKPAVTLTPVREEDLALWPAVPPSALPGFAQEIVAERAAGGLRLLGRDAATAARKLRS